MDNNKLLAALEESEERLAEALRDKGTDIKDIGLILETLAHVRGLAEAIARREDSTPYKPITYSLETHEVITPEPEGQPAGASFVEEKEPKAAKKAESAPVESATVEPAVTPCPKPEHKLTKAEVRTALSAYANAGADVATVMQGMGYAKLSDVPEDKYPELLEAAKKAVQ